VRPELTRIEPVFVPRIWGVRSLAPLYPEKSNMSEPIGEVWLTGIDCRIVSGPFLGKTLGEAWREMKTLWRGTLLKNVDDFPILVKFIFPSDKLSIQVHPDDVYAAAHEAAAGGRGKTEMWHVISATTGAQVLVGLKPGTDKEKFLGGLAQRTLENLFEVYPVRTGDTFFVPAGTPHTIGPNMVVFEVQEYSDLTYRLYDYDRVDAQGNPRTLHVAKALEVVKFGAIKGGRVPALELSATGLKKELLAGCRYFVAERWEFSKPTELYTNAEHFNILIFLSGEGEIEAENQRVRYHQGEVWFVPACISSPKVIPGKPTTFLRAYVADMEDFKSNLLDEGFDAASIAQTIFE
jgi:mannose-6-phosphate isomerase